mmetsp:Transcript_14254/g.21658  ORF Transcript_14254/g.21658 Transcript_14254/m.21658 type:complete len:779 (-) Transcript_14254:177-2513(-)
MSAGNKGNKRSSRAIRPLTRILKARSKNKTGDLQLWQAFGGDTQRAEKVAIRWEKFESTIGFNIQKHINDYFSKVDINEAGKHKHTLEAKQEETSKQLQRFVTTNYEKFIHISNEIMDIEEDMAKLTNMLGNYKGIMKQLQNTSLDFSAFDNDGQNAAIASANVNGEMSVQDLCEEVGILVYQCKYKDAVQKVRIARDKVNSMSKTTETRELKALVQSQVREVVSALLGELRRARNSGSTGWGGGDLESVRIIRYLLDLDRDTEALEILLSTRSSALRTEVRSIKFQGDAAQYISSLSAVVFRGIALCIDEFREIFWEQQSGGKQMSFALAYGSAAAKATSKLSNLPRSNRRRIDSKISIHSPELVSTPKNTNPMMAAVVQWVIEELGEFVQRFNTQVSEARANFFHLGECLRSAFENCKRLDEKGLNLTFILARKLLPIVKQAIIRAMRHTVTQIKKSNGELKKETWLSKRLIIRESNKSGGKTKKDIKLTLSGIYLYNSVRTLLEGDLMLVIKEDVLPFSTNELYSTVAKNVVELLLDDVIMAQYRIAMKSLPLKDQAEHLSILANFQFLGADLLPRVERSLTKLFKRQAVHDVRNFDAKLGSLASGLRKFFCKTRAKLWAEDLKWTSEGNVQRYCKRFQGDEKYEREMEKKMLISEEYIMLVENCKKLMDDIATHLRDRAIPKILKDSFEHLLKLLSNSSHLKTLPLPKLGYKQLYLDISFFSESCRSISQQKLTSICKLYSHDRKRCFCKSLKAIAFWDIERQKVLRLEDSIST